MKQLAWFLFVGLCLLAGGCANVNYNAGVNQIQLAIYSGLCLDVLDASTASGAPVQAYACGPGKLSQEWTLKPVTPGSMSQVLVVNANSEMCMSVADNPDTAPGQAVIQEGCVGDGSQLNQVWSLKPAPGGEAGFQFISMASSQCLDLPYGAVASTFDMQQYYCTPSDPAQGWQVNPVSLGNTP